MEKIIISVFGKDRPGILAAVSRSLTEQGCNIENISQTILQQQFAGIFIASIPPGLSVDRVDENLKLHINSLGLDVHVKPLDQPISSPTTSECEPFIVTAVGADRKGLVAGITEIFTEYFINVTNLKAVFKGGNAPGNNIMIYEVDIPADVDHSCFKEALRKKADSLGLDISIQHRKVFEMINKI